MLLRDWRRDEPTKMDPHLLDLIWEVYQQSGSKDYIHVVCGYRSPATNNMLRHRGRGVAKFSQHMLGKAMDFFLPDVKLATLREIGLKMQNGGVGYYPTSGSPFVHMDTGNVRHWPRMSRQELARVFPDGKTLHIPADGKPLPGYEQAIAAYEARRGGKAVEVAQAEPSAKKLNFFQRWAQSVKQDQQDDEDANSLPGINMVKTSEEPAETNPVVLAGGASAKGNSLPGVEIAGAQESGAKIGKSDGVSLQQTQFEIAQESLPVPQRSPRRFAGDALALVAANAGSRADQAITALDRAGKLTAKLSDGSFSVAALSADDIENLRRTAVPAARAQSSVEERLAAGLKPPAPLGAEQSAAEGETEVILARLNSAPQPQHVERSGAQANGSEIAIPKKNPARRPPPAAANRTLELALAPTEENQSAAADAIRALIEADGGQTGSIRSVNAKRSARFTIADWALANKQSIRMASSAHRHSAWARSAPDQPRSSRPGFNTGADRDRLGEIRYGAGLARLSSYTYLRR